MESRFFIKAIIFDCDGTLVNSEQFHYLAWQDALQKRGHFLNEEFYIEHLAGLCDLEIAKISFERFNITDSEELLKDKINFFDAYQDKGISPISATVEFVKRLFQEKQKYGYKLAVASGARKKEILHFLKALQIEHCFEVILSGRDDLSEYHDLEGTNKPKPYVYLKTAKMLGLKSEECLAIEDSFVGVTAAINAGCLTLAIPNPYTIAHDLTAAHIKIESFEGMSLDHFVHLMR